MISFQVILHKLSDVQLSEIVNRHSEFIPALVNDVAALTALNHSQIDWLADRHSEFIPALINNVATLKKLDPLRVYWLARSYEALALSLIALPDILINLSGYQLGEIASSHSRFALAILNHIDIKIFNTKKWVGLALSSQAVAGGMLKNAVCRDEAHSSHDQAMVTQYNKFTLIYLAKQYHYTVKYDKFLDKGSPYQDLLSLMQNLVKTPEHRFFSGHAGRSHLAEAKNLIGLLHLHNGSTLPVHDLAALILNCYQQIKPSLSDKPLEQQFADSSFLRRLSFFYTYLDDIYPQKEENLANLEEKDAPELALTREQSAAPAQSYMSA